MPGNLMEYVSAVFFLSGILVAYDKAVLGNISVGNSCRRYVLPAKIGIAIIIIDAVGAFLLINLIPDINRGGLAFIFMCVALVGFVLIGQYVACVSRGRASF
jgi:hypothetical protein